MKYYLMEEKLVWRAGNKLYLDGFGKKDILVNNIESYFVLLEFQQTLFFFTDSNWLESNFQNLKRDRSILL
jgi:hypothetical protein